MKKAYKRIAIIIILLTIMVLIDTIQAKVFNNSPIITIKSYYEKDGRFGLQRTDIGIFVSTDYYENGNRRTFFHWQERLI